MLGDLQEALAGKFVEPSAGLVLSFGVGLSVSNIAIAAATTVSPPGLLEYAFLGRRSLRNDS